MKYNINKEEFEKAWIADNLSIEEMTKKFGVSRSTIKARIKEFDLHKPECLKQKKIESTMMKRYGCRRALQNQEFRNKAIQTTVERFGVEYSLQNPELREKVKNTNMVLYGCKNPQQNRDIFEKTIKTCRDKYGAPYAVQNDAVKQKRKDLFFERYGVENPSLLDSVKSKREQTFLERFGVSNPSWKNFCRETVKALSSEENFKNFIKENNIKDATDLSVRLGVGVGAIYRYINKFDAWNCFDLKMNHKEREVSHFLDSIGVRFEKTRKIINPYEIDFYCPDYKIGIEFNGTYWHSNLKKEPYYHFNKSILGASAGIHIFHIYEDEWSDPDKRTVIENYLKNLFSNDANSSLCDLCEIFSLSKNEASLFMKCYSITPARDFTFSCGLFYKGELLQALSFKNISDGCWRIENFSFKENVIGGFEKLFLHFVQLMDPISISFDVDFNKFNGERLQNVGMKFIGYSGPDMRVVVNGKVFYDYDNSFELYKESADAIIWGAGSKKFLWTKPETK